MRVFEKMADDAGENAPDITLDCGIPEEVILLLHAYDMLDEKSIDVKQFSSPANTAYKFSSGVTSVYVAFQKADGKRGNYRAFFTIAGEKFSLTESDGEFIHNHIINLYEKARGVLATKMNRLATCLKATCKAG